MASSASDFLSEVADLYAAYFDAIDGFRLVRERLIETQSAAARQSGRSVAELDGLRFIYGHGDPNHADARVLVEAPQGVVKVRNAKDGRNTHFLGQMLIVAIYQRWEDHYRDRIAGELGLWSKNELTSNLFGEIRRLRQAIVHNKGVVTSEGGDNRILRWFVRGEPATPNADQMKELFFLLVAELEDLARRSVA